ncbi:putative 39S ribosomal protein L45, mitochondrial, partial [Fragariocoptes setiger]
MQPDEIRSKLKEKGVAPPRPWEERKLYIASTNAVIDQYVPPEGDGVASFLSVDKAKQLSEATKRKAKQYREVNKIREFEGEDFNIDIFAEKCIEIYENAHLALMEKDMDNIFKYVTEWCYPFMAEGMRNSTIHWKLLENVEPPRVVNVKSGDNISKGNTYAQITVRFHTKQLLAVYDRHGRLTRGSETSIRQCVEYIVFEKYLANEYGTWRMHSKILPKWHETTVPQTKKTYVASN